MNCFRSYLLSDELGRATDIGRLPMSSGLSTPIFALIKKDNFWSCPTRDFRAKLSPKIGDFEFGWISLRDRVGFSNCLDLRMHYFVAVSASNFHVLIYSS